MRASISLGIAWLVGLATLSCGATRTVSVVNDVTVSFDAPLPEKPIARPSARLEAAAREVREILGHPLAIELDASLAPEYRDSLENSLTHQFEELATRLVRLRGKDEATLALAKQRVAKIAVRYAPSASRDESKTRFEGENTVVVFVTKKSSQLDFVGYLMPFLEDESRGDEASDLAKMDPERVPPARYGAYVKWLRGSLDVGKARNPPDYKERELDRVARGLRFARSMRASEVPEDLLRFLFDTGLRDLAWGRYGQSARAAETAKDMAAWLERDFAGLSAERRGQVFDLLLGRSVTEPRLLETAFQLSVRTLDAWRSAGHPMPGREARIPHEFEAVVCPQPKDEHDNRSLGPNCDGGIVRLSLASPSGVSRLGEILASRHDPLLVEQILARSAPSSREGGPGFALVRAVENDAPSFRMALHVLAEEHAPGSVIDEWMAEVRRLWLAHPGARGALLYVLAHLVRYDRDKIDFADFGADFGGKVTAAEASAYLAEGYRALSLAPLVWPAFGDFSRAALLRPVLDGYLDDPRVPHFSNRAPYEPLVEIRHLLCDEGALDDMRDLSRYFAVRAKERPGLALGDMSKTFAPEGCDSACAKGRGKKCLSRSKGATLVRAGGASR